MKTAKRIAGAVAIVGAAMMAQGAMAADVSNPDTPLSLATGGDTFGHSFAVDNTGNGFSERYTFSVSNGGTVYADVFSNASSDVTGLDIQGLSLFSSSGLVLKGTQVATGKTDIWELTSGSLSAGSYFLLVTGTVLSNVVTSYTGSATVTGAVSAVPEAGTMGMLLGGLGLVGAMAARRQRKWSGSA